MVLRALSLPLLVFFGLTWGTFLAGIIILQLNCSGSTSAGLGTMDLAGTFGWTAGMPCYRIFRFYWFMVAWVFLVLLGAFITCLPRYGLHSSRPFWSGMFTVTALLFMIASEAMLAAWDAAPLQSSVGIRVAIAGAIATVVSSILMLFSIGTDWGYRRRMHDRRNAARRSGDDKYPRYGLGEPAGTPVGGEAVRP